MLINKHFDSDTDPYLQTVSVFHHFPVELLKLVLNLLQIRISHQIKFHQQTSKSTPGRSGDEMVEDSCDEKCVEDDISVMEDSSSCLFSAILLNKSFPFLLEVV